MAKGYEVGLPTSVVKKIMISMEDLAAAPVRLLNALALEENVSSFGIDPGKAQTAKIEKQKKVVKHKMAGLSAKANPYLAALSSLKGEIETLRTMFKLPTEKKKPKER